MSLCENERYQKRDMQESSMHYTVCTYLSVPVPHHSRHGSCFLCLAVRLFHVLYCVVFQCLPHCPEICRGDAIGSVRFHPSGFMLGPYQSMWLTVGQGLRPYLSILGDKQTHCISNIRNALVQSIDTRDTVQPQTV